jgi:hypothetical protein
VTINLYIQQLRYIDDLDIVLLCGGETFSKPQLEKIQCMAVIERRPLLSYIIDQISAFGAKKAIITLREDSRDIRKYFDNRYAFVDLLYSYEDEPLGTGGAVKKAISEYGTGRDILIFECNCYTNINIFDVRKFLSSFTNRNKIHSLSYDDKSHIIRNRKIPLASTYPVGIYLVSYEHLLTLPDKFSIKKDAEKEHLILDEHHQTADIGIDRWAIQHVKCFFRDIWGYDWSRYAIDDDIKICEYCMHSERIKLKDNYWHKWEIKCLKTGATFNRLHSCENFDIIEKPYIIKRIERSGTKKV